MEIKEVWKKSMEYIQSELAEVSFETRFLEPELEPEGIFIIENEDYPYVVIRVKKDHGLAKIILQERYGGMIESVLSAISGTQLKLLVLDSQELSPAGLVFNSLNDNLINSLDLELFEGEEAGLAIIPDKHPLLMHIVILKRDYYSRAVNKYDFQVTRRVVVNNLDQFFELPELKPDEITRIINKMRGDDKESRHMCDKIFNDRMLSLFMTFLGSGHFRNTIHYFTYEDAVFLVKGIFSLLPAEFCCFFDQVRLKDSAVGKMNDHMIISSDLKFASYNLQDVSPVLKECIRNGNDRSRCAFIKAMEIAGRSGFPLSDNLVEKICELILKEVGLQA